MTTAINQDCYGYVINGPQTYARLAYLLRSGHSVALVWTDGRGSDVSLLFSIPAVQLPEGDSNWAGLHLMVPATRALAVAVQGIGTLAAFPLDDMTLPLHPDYIAEKLFQVPKATSVTIERVADLINGVLAELQ